MMRPRPLDFCSGEELYIQEQQYLRDTGHGRRGTRDSPADVSNYNILNVLKFFLNKR